MGSRRTSISAGSAVVPALLQVVQALTADLAATVQLIAATHSPLVLASVEPWFDSVQ
jgi:predicted ATPase